MLNTGMYSTGSAWVGYVADPAVHARLRVAGHFFCVWGVQGCLSVVRSS